jgi:hypothetical protein
MKVTVKIAIAIAIAMAIVVLLVIRKEQFACDHDWPPIESYPETKYHAGCDQDSLIDIDSDTKLVCTGVVMNPSNSMGSVDKSWCREKK